ncbi:MAG: DMT family transporter [Candidatus Caenarcaniphilales bacterium]|nr:DMT family transporter [Candidatus Caenarcaniphilales bacterium]
MESKISVLKENTQLPIFALLLAALCYTSLVVANKWLNDHEVLAFEQIFWRVLISIIFAGLGVILFEKKNFQITQLELKYFAINAFLFLGGFSTFTLGITLGTPIAKAVALNYAYPLVIVIVNFLIFKEIPSLKHFVSIALSLLSVALVVEIWKTGSWNQFQIGELVALSNGIFYGTMIVFGKLVQQVTKGSLYRSLFYSQLFMLPLFVGLGFLLQASGQDILKPHLNLNLGGMNWIVLGLSSLSGGLMPLALIYFGVSKIKPYIASLLLLTEPVWVYFCGLIFFEQQLSWPSLAGILGIILSVLLV